MGPLPPKPRATPYPPLGLLRERGGRQAPWRARRRAFSRAEMGRLGEMAPEMWVLFCLFTSRVLGLEDQFRGDQFSGK